MAKNPRHRRPASGPRVRPTSRIVPTPAGSVFSNSPAIGSGQRRSPDHPSMLNRTRPRFQETGFEGACQCDVCAMEDQGATQEEIQRFLDAERDRTDAKIRDHGQSIVGVLGSANEPSWCYTVGRSARGLPELIVFTPNPRLGQIVLNYLNASWDLVPWCIENGFALEEPTTGMPMRFVEVDDDVWDTTDFLLGAVSYCERQALPRAGALQIVWPDIHDRYPWHPDYDGAMRTLQPLLGTYIEPPAEE